jgi:nucleoside-diphosphate-sugar epimerase
VTAHGKSKLRCERDLARLADMAFTPVFLRNAEVYGVSPRLRMDLIVNDLVGSAVTHGRVELRGGAGGWRSLVHVEDLCRTYAAVLTAPDDLVRSEVFNVTAPDADYRVIDVADAVTEMVPSCTRPLTVDLFDGKSVRTDGSKLRRRFPKLSFRWTLPLGIRQLQNAMLGAGVSPGDWRSDRYRRALRLQNLIDSGELDASLRRPEAALIS